MLGPALRRAAAPVGAFGAGFAYSHLGEQAKKESPGCGDAKKVIYSRSQMIPVAWVDNVMTPVSENLIKGKMVDEAFE